MRVSTAVRWTGLALLGILIAAAVSVAASRLASQQIGLASEPISAGDALAPAQRRPRPPAAAGPGVAKHVKPAHSGAIPTAPAQPPAEVAPAPSPPPQAAEASPGDGEQGGGADD